MSRRWMRCSPTWKPPRSSYIGVMTKCSIDGCATKAYVRGWCSKHYQRWLAHGDPLGGAGYRQKPPTHCTVEGCDRHAAWKSLCRMHYMRQYNGYDLTASVRPYNPGQPCSIEGCERPVHGRGWCRRHYGLWLRTGDPIPKGRATGKDHYHWRSDDEVSYATVHLRLRNQRGPAKDHTCCCGKRAAQWAFDKPVGYSPDLNRYVALCVSCHARRDRELLVEAYIELHGIEGSL